MSHLSEATATPVVTSPVPTASIIIATDGSLDSDGAVRVGRALAQRDGVAAELLSVVELFSILDHEGGPLPDIEHLTMLVREARAAELLAQRDRTHPGIQQWPFEIASGPRVETIIATAQRAGASLILLGLGAHGVAARLLQRETALQVIREATVPVLAVPRHAWGVPRSALAAVDFTRSSERAIAAAIDLLGGEGTLYVAHVLPRTTIPHAEPRTWDEPGRTAVLPRLEAMVRRLRPSPGIQIEYVLLHGEPAHELLAFAEERSIDLIAAGAHGRSPLERLILGSVSTTLVRTADRWVLVAPADAAVVTEASLGVGPNEAT